MTPEAFQSAIRTRFPNMAFEFARDSDVYKADHERCTIRHFASPAIPEHQRWLFSVVQAERDDGATLADAIETHLLRIQRINLHVAALGLDSRPGQGKGKDK